MAKKNKPVNTGTPKGIFRIREAGKNPANKKMFDAIANGELDENIVDKSYTMVDIGFVDNELDCVCRVMTRDKIQAYANDIGRSVETLANQFIQGLSVKDNASEITQKIIDDVAATFDHDDDEIKKIVVMSVIRNAVMSATGIVKTVNVAANDSEVVEEVQTVDAEITETNAEPIETSDAVDVDYVKVEEEPVNPVDDIKTKIKENALVKMFIESIANNPESIKELMDIFIKHPDVIESLNLQDIVMSGMNPDVVEKVKKIFGDNEPSGKKPAEKTVHDIRKEKISEAVNQKPTTNSCVALIEGKSLEDNHGSNHVSVVNRIREVNRTMFNDIDDIFIRAGLLPATN